MIQPGAQGTSSHQTRWHNKKKSTTPNLMSMFVKLRATPIVLNWPRPRVSGLKTTAIKGLI